ncbi:MAG: ComF family protein [Colwellia sp.]|nr:ComF family protein [Colwellia sp.]
MEFSSVRLACYFERKHSILSEKVHRLKVRLSCCELCGGSCQTRTLLCDFCATDLPLFDLQSVQGNLLLWPAINALLPKRKFTQLICVAPYHWPIDLWVRQLKYQGRFELIPLLSSLLFQQWQSSLKQQITSSKGFIPPSLLLTVPIHIKKWQKRGFNQTHLLANKFAEQANINYLPKALLRIHEHNDQAGQTGVTRRRNLRDAFALSPALTSALPEQVLLLDDVVTTGSTCNEICRILKQHGVKEVTVLSLCLSLPETQT